jgi:hypothetical protein
MAGNPKDEGSAKELKDSVESLGSPIEKILDAIGNMYKQADKLNNAFVQGRTRMDEMNDAVSKAAAGVIRLGGDINDISNTMAGIAEGSRRNVLATEEQVSKLYAASSVLGLGAKDLVEDFAKVGYETSQIGPNLEKSIEYVQSVGLNARTVMKDVANNMELMNRFNFNDGVQGLTKMAAQASMLRFDMKTTAEFANKVIDPEGAINMAASFQRLGLAVGQLGDPFALMNDAINDPGALQDSLIKSTKQFTEFDEKTKSFKINPQGVLTLREMSKETGISYEQLTKSALAAADLDKRVSAINPSLKFKDEEDKQFFANMATMKDGEYVVQLKDDETGIVQTKKLGDITQDEMEKLREQQANAPKTLEEIQTSQLDVLKNIQRAIEGNTAKGTYGIAGSSAIRGNLLGAERITRSLTKAVDTTVPGSAAITEKVNDAIKEMRDLYVANTSGKLSNEDLSKKVAAIEEGITNTASGMGTKGIEALKDILQKTSQGVTGSSGIEKEFKKYSEELLTAVGRPTTAAASAVKTKAAAATQKPISLTDVLGERTLKQNANLTNTESKTTNTKVEFGEFKITIDTPPGTTLTQQQLNAIFNSDQFKQYVLSLADPKSNKGQGVVSY